MENFKIAISGELGSGKTVLSNKLSAVLGAKIISVGLIQRQLAQRYGMTTLEFNKYMETHPEIDKECDNMVSSYGNENYPIILDSRLAWNFVPHSFKVHLIVDSKIAAKRIFNDSVRKNETYTSIEVAEKNLIERKNSELLRFKQQYNININDYDNYDLVIDTTYLNPDMVFEKVLEVFMKWKQGQFFNNVFLSPKSIYPTQSIREHSFSHSKEISESIKKHGYFEDSPIFVININSKYFIFDGHKRTSASIINKLDLIPCILIGTSSKPLPIKQSVSEYIKDNFNIKYIYDWEAMHQFNFSDYITNL